MTGCSYNIFGHTLSRAYLVGGKNKNLGTGSVVTAMYFLNTHSSLYLLIIMNAGRKSCHEAV